MVSRFRYNMQEFSGEEQPEVLLDQFIQDFTQVKYYFLDELCTKLWLNQLVHSFIWLTWLLLMLKWLKQNLKYLKLHWNPVVDTMDLLNRREWGSPCMLTIKIKQFWIMARLTMFFFPVWVLLLVSVFLQTQISKSSSDLFQLLGQILHLILVSQQHQGFLFFFKLVLDYGLDNSSSYMDSLIRKYHFKFTRFRYWEVR